MARKQRDNSVILSERARASPFLFPLNLIYIRDKIYSGRDSGRAEGNC